MQRQTFDCCDSCGHCPCCRKGPFRTAYRAAFLAHLAPSHSRAVRSDTEACSKLAVLIAVILPPHLSLLIPSPSPTLASIRLVSSASVAWWMLLVRAAWPIRVNWPRHDCWRRSARTRRWMKRSCRFCFDEHGNYSRAHINAQRCYFKTTILGLTAGLYCLLIRSSETGSTTSFQRNRNAVVQYAPRLSHKYYQL
jgi:hypothetical protein